MDRAEAILVRLQFLWYAPAARYESAPAIAAVCVFQGFPSLLLRLIAVLRFPCHIHWTKVQIWHYFL